MAQLLFSAPQSYGHGSPPTRKSLTTRYDPDVEHAVDRKLARLLERAQADPDVLAVIVFGSQARGEAGPDSDVDVCLVLSSPVDRDAAFRAKRSYSGGFDVDLALFHELPLHIRRRVSREGKVLFTRDEERLYEVAIRAAREFEDFKHIQRAYLDEVARG